MSCPPPKSSRHASRSAEPTRQEALSEASRMRRDAQAARDAQVYKLRMEPLPVKVVAERLKMSDRSVEYAMARYLEAHPDADRPESSKAMAARILRQGDTEYRRPSGDNYTRFRGDGGVGEAMETARPSSAPLLHSNHDDCEPLVLRSGRGAFNLDWSEL